MKLLKKFFFYLIYINKLFLLNFILLKKNKYIKIK